MNRIFSGIQPSGNLHLGNYLGAIRNFVRLQDDYECIYCVVDLHALTMWQEPQELRAQTREVAATFIAAVCALLLALGCVLEALSMLLLIMPVIQPALIDLGIDAIWFGHTEQLPARVLLAFRLDVNEWKGERKVQFLVEGAQL